MATSNSVALPAGFELEPPPSPHALPPGFELEPAHAAPKDYDEWQEGQPPPDGFNVVSGATSSTGKPYLVHKFGMNDFMAALNDLPGVGTAAAIGQGATRLAGKAASGIAGGISSLLGGDGPGTVSKVQNAVNGATQLPQSNDPLMQAARGAAGLVQKGVDATGVEQAQGNLSPGLRTTLEGVEQAIPDIAGLVSPELLGGEGATAEAGANIAKTGAEVSKAAGYTGLRTKADLASPGAQGITDKLIGSDAGMLPEQAPNVANLENARRIGPAKQYDATREALPDQLTQDEGLQTELQNVSGQVSQLPTSPDVDALKETMLGQPNMSKDDLFANISEARQRAKANWKSDDPDKNALGDAYSRVADAYENFVGRQPGVDLPAWQQARVQMAKNYLAQGALRGEHFNAQAYGRAMEQNPGMLTGNAAIVGHTANSLPASTGMGMAGALAPSAAGALAGEVAGQHFGVPGAGAIAGATAAPLARAAIERFLTRGKPAAAAGTSTNPALSYFFDHPAAAPPEEPLPPGIAGLLPAPSMVNAGGGATTSNILNDLGLTPDVQAAGAAHPGAPREPVPTGTSPEPRPPMAEIPFQGPQNWSPFAPGGAPAANAEDAWFTGGGQPKVGNRLAPSGADRGGDISLADLLSHGVEQEPAAGLTAGPMGAPAAQGVPFRRDPGQLAGELSLADHFAPQQAANNSDVAGVMSQGVPEDIAARGQTNSVQTSHEVVHAADDTGVHTFSTPHGEATAIENGPYLQLKRSDVAEEARGTGEGMAIMERAAQEAGNRGLRLASDVSVSPDAQRLYAGMRRRGFTVQKNPANINPSTGNLVSVDPRKPVFVITPKQQPLAEALGGQ
jgi:GNAT superfamily N-acetyltransferase